jgi:hypothetical protein
MQRADGGASLMGRVQTGMNLRRELTVVGWLCLSGLYLPARAADLAIEPPPTTTQWAALAHLPDWSGVWTPNMTDQDERITRDPTPWRADIKRQVMAMMASEAAGHPRGLFVDCLPEGMPSWMLISHNAFEVLFTPGRVTLLGEMDGNRLRRIYTDGRPHPVDPDPTFHGHSIGHWEGVTLVVDTIGIVSESYIAVSEAVGVPNNGDMHVIERIHLTGPDTLRDDLEIVAPKVLSAPWKTARIYYRQRARKYAIVEGVCLQGTMMESRDEFGNPIYKPTPWPDGNPQPLK